MPGLRKRRPAPVIGSTWTTWLRADNLRLMVASPGI
jgi:hypothetical protein